MDPLEAQKMWKQLLEKATECAELLNQYTQKLENAASLSEEELKQVSLNCKEIRLQIDNYMMKMKDLAEESSYLFTQNRELARLYNNFHERIRRVHETTLHVIKVLKDRMNTIDDEINTLQRKKHAILMYKSHQVYK